MNQSYSYDTFITGSDPVATTAVTIASGEVLEAKTPLGMVTATGKIKAYDPAASDGTEKAVYISAQAIDATGGDTITQVYKAGTFNPELLGFPEVTTDAQKRAAFVGTPISLQNPTA